MPNHQLTKDERHAITYLNMHGHGPAEIARRLGRHRGTIGRELKRNPDAFCGYHYESAQRQAEHRRSEASTRYKLDDADSTLGQAVRHGLKERWSPEEIANRLGRDHPQDPSVRISHEAIYQWVYREAQNDQTHYQRLRRRRKRRRCRIPGGRNEQRGQIIGRVGIEQRPAEVDQRRRFGHWESDTIEGAKSTGLVVTHVERKSRLTRLAKLNSKQAKELSRATNRRMKDLPKCLLRTMTPDNGKEFADFKTIEDVLDVKVYFANPHCPWERGTNENTNGLLRDWLPKGSDFSQVTDQQLAEIERSLNNRPRKCLNYRTPLEVVNALPGVALRN